MNHESRYLPPLLVRTGDHGRLGHGVVLDQCGLDLEGADPVPGGDDEVVLAGEEPEESVLVLHAAVPGQVEVSTERV